MEDSPEASQEALSRMVSFNDIVSLERAFASNSELILTGRNFTLSLPALQKSLLPNNGLSLLHVAAYHDNFEVFHYLASKGGASLNLRTPSSNSYFPLHYACFGSAKECAAYILACDPAQAALEHDCSFQAVFLATLSNSSDILELLLSHGADLRSPKNVQNHPFSQALKMNHLDCVLVLLQHSCKTDVDGFSMTPLMMAVTRKAEGALEWLLDRGHDPTFVSVRGDTALALACNQTDLTAVKILCSRMEDIEIPETEERLSSIARWAVGSKNIEILRIILKKGCDVNRYDKASEQPADAIRGLVDDATGLKMLEMLIEHGYDIHGRDPKSNKAFLDRVVEFTPGNHPKIVDFLLSKGADPRVVLADGITTLGIVKGWKRDKYARGIKLRYVEIFSRYFPEEFQ
jgi:ankyrin repeat protein